MLLILQVLLADQSFRACVQTVSMLSLNLSSLVTMCVHCRGISENLLTVGGTSFEFV